MDLNEPKTPEAPEPPKLHGVVIDYFMGSNINRTAAFIAFAVAGVFLILILGSDTGKKDEWKSCVVEKCEFMQCRSLNSDKCFHHTPGDSIDKINKIEALHGK